jgi:hypothetical protein
MEVVRGLSGWMPSEFTDSLRLRSMLVWLGGGSPLGEKGFLLHTLQGR